MSEKRKSRRSNLSWPISVWVPRLNRFSNCNLKNISSGGCLAEKRISFGFKMGEIVEVNFPRTDRLAKLKGTYSRIKTAKVVRIKGNDVAVEFDVKESEASND